MDIEIKPIAEDHVEGFHRALDIVARERKYLAFLEAPPLEKTRDFILNNIANGYPQFVGVAGGEVVGWCDIIPKGLPIYAHCGVMGVSLIPEYRGRGLGKPLMLTTIEAAWRFGLTRIELTVRASNTRAFALYRKLGFEQEGVLRKRALIDGVRQDVILMSLRGPGDD